MKNEVLKNLTLTVIFDDGKEIRCPYSLEKEAFDYDPAELDLEHDLTKMLRVQEVTEEGAVAFSYIFDGDYDPRRLVLPAGEKLEITDHIKVGGIMQRVRLIIGR